MMPDLATGDRVIVRHHRTKVKLAKGEVVDPDERPGFVPGLHDYVRVRITKPFARELHKGMEIYAHRRYVRRLVPKVAAETQEKGA